MIQRGVDGRVWKKRRGVDIGEEIGMLEET